MPLIPLFDANAHPRFSGDDSFAALRRELDDCGFGGACAVGLPGRGEEGQDGQLFFDVARKFGMYPVAAWQCPATVEIEGKLASLRSIGYRAIKIHPRRSGLSVRDARFAESLRFAAVAGMTVFFCTYQFGGSSDHPVDPLPMLMDAIVSAPGLKILLLHGGTVEVLRYAECIRSRPGILLDLSFTLNRYEGSSLDADLQYLFRTFDSRICIGSDFPDFRPDQVRRRFQSLANGLDHVKHENIAWRNITRFLGLDQLTTAMG